MVFRKVHYQVKDRGTYYNAPRRANAFASRGPQKRAGASFSRWSAPRSSLKRRPAAREVGYVDLATAAYALDTTGSIALLNTVAQGASINQRIGKKITLKSLQCRGFCANNATSTYNDVAFLIVHDKRPDGNLPAITDILETASASSFNNTQNEGRFRVLKRVDFNLIGSAANQYTECTTMNADFFLDLKSIPTTYKAAGTGAIGDIEDGALYIVSVGSGAAGTTAAVASLGFRLRYWDV